MPVKLSKAVQRIGLKKLQHQAPVGKIILTATEDWFILSHFKPLLLALRNLSKELVVVTRCSGREGEIEALGARVVSLDFRRKSLNAFEQARAAFRLSRIFAREKPEIVHLVALNPIVIGAAAVSLRPVPVVVAHVTGLGYLGTANTVGVRVARRLSLFLVNRTLQRRIGWVFAENASDLRDLAKFGVRCESISTILGGAGIDPDVYRALPPPENPFPVAASVSRLIHSKGLDVLVAAHDRLAQRGVRMRLRIFGRHDPGNPEAIAPAVIEEWLARDGVEGGQEVENVRAVWEQADIAVLPARAREGMPRAMLEAAACARPLIVTDVPGLRDFVTHGREGLLVPPGDPDALADALEQLANRPNLRIQMGQAARARILSGFTNAHLITAVERVYRDLAKQLRGSAGEVDDGTIPEDPGRSR